MASAVAVPAERVVVHSIHGRHNVYLEIVPEGSGIRIQPTQRGKRALNRFWTMWLRKLLLEQAPVRRVYSIEIRKNNVLVTSPNSSAQALVGTVHQIAAQLRPLNEPPIVPNKYGDFGKKERRYEIKFASRQIAWEEIVNNITMPRGVRLELSLWDEVGEGRICLVRPVDHPLSLSQLGMLLELEVALACRQ